MVLSQSPITEAYWENFELRDEDIEFLYNFLLESETPLTPQELVGALVAERVRRERAALAAQRQAGGTLYQPKKHYAPGESLTFPTMGWRQGEVSAVRPGYNPDLGEFSVISVTFANGEERQFAADLSEHALNGPLPEDEANPALDHEAVLDDFEELLIERLEEGLGDHADFVRIAGRWFPRALLLDIGVGQLNLAEAVLDMAGGGPLSTSDLIDQIGMQAEENAKLLTFSFDLALQEDPRFDEVGSSGRVLWYLRRLEPPEVLEPPLTLRYQGTEYDRSLLSPDMLALERQLDDELSPLHAREETDEAALTLIYPHWRAGTLPLAAKVRHLFPTAYESPRIQFTLVDGDTGERISAWVVREKRYVFGLKDWYKSRNLIPGSLIKVQRGENPGEVIIRTDSRRTTREWVRTVLVGSDGGVVFAMLKQVVAPPYDERMTIATPDESALDVAWARFQKEHRSLEQTVTSMVRELAKLNPQRHVHVSELYAAVNIVRRCPPAPIMALLASHKIFTHVGDMHYRFAEVD
jgi:hypothetical protein